MPTRPLTEAQLEQTKKAVEKSGGDLFAAAKALGVHETSVRRRMRILREKSGEVVLKPPKAGRDLNEFRSQYDKSYIVPKKIKAALQALGPDGWEYESQFAKLAGVSLTDLSAFRDEFAVHVVTLGRDSRRAWAGTAATAQKMREMLS